MPSIRAVRLYELGLRITQAAKVFDCNDEQFGCAFRKSVLIRLESALRRLTLTGIYATAVSSRCLSITTDCQRYLSNRAESGSAEITTLLTVLRDFLVEEAETSGQPDEDDAVWLRLGLEIGSGCGEAWDPGRLEIRDDQMSGVPGTQRAATWGWPNRNAVDELLGRLSERLETLFPGYNGTTATDSALNEDDRAALPGLPGRYWGWWALDRGLRALLREAEQAALTACPQPGQGTAAPATIQPDPADISPAIPVPLLPHGAAVAPTAAPLWYHDTSEVRPTEFCFGPLFGRKQQLAGWILLGKKDPRALETMGRDGRCWITKQGRASFEVYFKNETMYRRANAAKSEGESARDAQQSPGS